MGLLERVQEDLKSAMRERHELRRETLRMVLSEVKNKRIELGRELEEPEVEATLQRCVKSRQDSVEQYAQAGREELAAKERAEIAVIQAYLPEQLSDADVRAAVEEAIREAGASSKKDMGAVMKRLMARHKGRIDGRTAQQVAGELLD